MDKNNIPHILSGATKKYELIPDFYFDCDGDRQEGELLLNQFDNIHHITDNFYYAWDNEAEDEGVIFWGHLETVAE